MSAGADVAVLVPSGSARSHSRRAATVRADRPVVRLVAFGALGLYGILRWATLMTPAPVWRLLGLLVLSLAIVGAGTALRGRSRLAIALLAVLSLLAAFALAGVPLSWVRHFRIAVTANGISEGLSASAAGAAALPRHQPMDPDRDGARRWGAATRRGPDRRAGPARAERRAARRGGDGADRAGGRSLDARPPRASLPTGPDPVPARGGLHVGRSDPAGRPRRPHRCSRCWQGRRRWSPLRGSTPTNRGSTTRR